MPSKDRTPSPSLDSFPAWCSPSAGPSLNTNTKTKTKTKTPPPHICAKINAQVAANPALGRPDFDFANHVRSRAYTIQTFEFEDGGESAVLLDTGVERLLPPAFAPPYAPFRTGTGPGPGPGNGTFVIGDAGENGLGMFAARDIPSGALILAEHPLIVAPYLMGISVRLADVYAELFRRLSPESRHDLMALANSRPVGECGALEAVVRTNALGIQLRVPDVEYPEIATHRAVFVNTSRCNHSCGPNARWEWDTHTFALYLSAVRPIMHGEEITIQYIACTAPRDERRAALEALYGFTCRCAYCTLSPDATEKSDAARVWLGEFWGSLPPFEAWCLERGTLTSPSTPSDEDRSENGEPEPEPEPETDPRIRAHLTALRLIKHEQLHVLDPERHVDEIAMCFGALGDREMFRAWTRRVRDAKVGVVGVCSGGAGAEGEGAEWEGEGKGARGEVFRKWLERPESFPTWGWKVGFRDEREEEEE
ncbi:hypothetical protein H0H81_011438 [Sphagnurus paluster]|uniref:SET domain-containing protein n=1 Tax=Sphagnurus paluster TaxID=117069 RepID=A0A9P7KNM6_9AGAR|nr:hypothetical protein H0H81_011438 [Sphagnurus paluster]